MSESVRHKRKKKSIPDTTVCTECYEGTCCREGVEVDLLEVARILELPLHIPKPWFEFLGRDKSFTSGFKFGTVLKEERCVFQDRSMRCSIYEIRPRFCVEFPLEAGKKAPYYHSLCHHARRKRKK